MITTTSRRNKVELLLPGFLIGLFAGGLAGALAGLGHLGATYALTSSLSFGLALGLGGAGYNWLLASGKIRMGGIAPAWLYWLPLFIVARVIEQVAVGLVVYQHVSFRDSFWLFVMYQGILSLGWAIGFIWLHEHIAPHWWSKVRGHNPIAAAYIQAYVDQAGAMGTMQGPSGPIPPSRRQRRKQEKANAAVPEQREPALSGKRR